MLYYTTMFLIAGLLALVIGFGEIAGGLIEFAEVAVLLVMGLFIITMIASFLRRGALRAVQRRSRHL